MIKNIGSLDRTLRFLLGAVIAVAGWYFHSWLGLLGLVFIATAAINFCPLYAIFRIKTTGSDNA